MRKGKDEVAVVVYIDILPLQGITARRRLAKTPLLRKVPTAAEQQLQTN